MIETETKLYKFDDLDKGTQNLTADTLLNNEDVMSEVWSQLVDDIVPIVKEYANDNNFLFDVQGNLKIN